MISKTIIIIFLVFSYFIQAQEKLKVEYDIVFKKTSVDFGGMKISESHKERILEQLKNKKKYTYTLFYNKGNSYFVRNTKNKQKTEYFKLKNQDGTYKLNDYIAEKFYSYHTNDDIKVEYTDQVEIIEDYICKLALLEKPNETVKVWYTEVIPISAGPYFYNNLPGLVLKLETANNILYATSISKDCKADDIKKMNLEFEIYKEGPKLDSLHQQAREKMSNYFKEKIGQMYR